MFARFYPNVDFGNNFREEKMTVIDFKEIFVGSWNAFALGRVRYYKYGVHIETLNEEVLSFFNDCKNEKTTVTDLSVSNHMIHHIQGRYRVVYIEKKEIILRPLSPRPIR